MECSSRSYGDRPGPATYSPCCYPPTEWNRNKSKRSKDALRDSARNTTAAYAFRDLSVGSAVEDGHDAVDSHGAVEDHNLADDRR